MPAKEGLLAHPCFVITFPLILSVPWERPNQLAHTFLEDGEQVGHGGASRTKSSALVHDFGTGLTARMAKWII